MVRDQKGFDTIALHSEELHEALLQVKILAEVNKKFSSELRHIAPSMGVCCHSFPPGPWH
jgi:hypothetical protein